MSSRVLLILSLGVALCLGTVWLAEPVAGASLEDPDLATEIRRAGHDGKQWLVYDIEMDGPERFVCCHRISRGISRDTVDYGTCRPESSRNTWTSTRGLSTVPRSRTLLIYLGVEDGEVQKVRTFSEGCDVEVTWPLRRLDGVSQNQSLGVLRNLVLADPRNDDALAAVAMHRSADAARVLAELSEPEQDRDLREQALFWLAQTGDPTAERFIFRSLHDDPSRKVREHAVLALSQLPDGRAVDALLEAMRTSDDGDVQRQALFWLAQSNDPRAMELISELLDS